MKLLACMTLSFVLGAVAATWAQRPAEPPPSTAEPPPSTAEPRAAKPPNVRVLVPPTSTLSGGETLEVEQARVPLQVSVAHEGMDDPGDVTVAETGAPNEASAAQDECAELAERLAAAQERLRAAWVRAQRHEKDLRRYRSKLQIGREKVERVLGDDAFLYPDEVLEFAGDMWDLKLAPMELTREDAVWLCVNEWHGTWPEVDSDGHGDYDLSIAERWGAERLATEVDAQNLYDLIGWLPWDYAAREFGPWAMEIHDRLTESQQEFFRAYVGLELPR